MTWHRIDDPENPAPKDGTLIVVAWWNRARSAWAARDARWDGSAWACPYGDIFETPDFWAPFPNPPEKERT